MSIRCHFDGKVIVPDEPVDLPINLPLTINVSAGVYVSHPRGRQSTVATVRNSGLIGAWKHRTDVTDSATLARKLREDAEYRGNGE